MSFIPCPDTNIKISLNFEPTGPTLSDIFYGEISDLSNTCATVSNYIVIYNPLVGNIISQCYSDVTMPTISKETGSEIFKLYDNSLIPTAETVQVTLYSKCGTCSEDPITIQELQTNFYMSNTLCIGFTKTPINMFQPLILCPL